MTHDAQPSVSGSEGCPFCGLIVADGDVHFWWHVEETQSADQLKSVLNAYGKL